MFYKQKYSRLQVQTRYKSFPKSLALVNFYYSETSKPVTSLQAIDTLQILELECQLHVKNSFKVRFLNIRVGQSPPMKFVNYRLRKSKY